MGEIVAAPGHDILVVGPYCWGTGKTFQEAFRKAKKEEKTWIGPLTGNWVAYQVPEGTGVTERGTYFRCNPSKNCKECGEIIRSKQEQRE